MNKNLKSPDIPIAVAELPNKERQTIVARSDPEIIVVHKIYDLH
jgi:hypothetical protein